MGTLSGIGLANALRGLVNSTHFCRNPQGSVESGIQMKQGERLAERATPRIGLSV